MGVVSEDRQAARAADYLLLLRPHQWTKNLLCFAGAVFGTGRLTQPPSLALDLAVFAVFCAISSTIYVFNDILDRQRDRLHPVKRRRPIADGRVGVGNAAVLAAILGLAALLGAGFLGPKVLFCVALFAVNNVAYSLWLKHEPIVDVVSIAAGFVLRLLAGIYVLGDLPTAWIVLCTFSLAVFLGYAKRRAELGSLAGEEPAQRRVLAHYSLSYLDGMLLVAMTMTLVSYAMFTVLSEDKSPTMILTLPIVFYAVMHYTRVVTVGSHGEEPERVLLKDRRILVSVVLWLILYVLIDHAQLDWFR